MSADDNRRLCLAPTGVRPGAESVEPLDVEGGPEEMSAVGLTATDGPRVAAFTVTKRLNRAPAIYDAIMKSAGLL
jgi:hypothetical protein